LDEKTNCPNECRYWIAGDALGDEAKPAVCGIDCDVEILSWGGDVDDVSAETYCRECAWARHVSRLEYERKQMLRKEANARRLEEEVRASRPIRETWERLSHAEFELQCAGLFRDIGYTATMTPISKDGGIDIRLRKDDRNGAAQCKCWRNPCGVKAVREFYGVVLAEGFDFAYFVAKSGFTTEAKFFLQKARVIAGWNLEDLIRMSSARLG
jgi:restriction endonuclease Mrr